MTLKLIDLYEINIDRKKFPSIILQGTCDHLKRLTDCFIGFPGSVHDAHVFENSDLKKRIKHNPLLMVPKGSYLVGDAAYKLESYMMTPYKDMGHFTVEQRRYNYAQSVTRNVIERAFALLKGRFPRLKLVEIKDLNHLCSYILAMCTLHNFCLNEDICLCEDNFVDFYVDSEEEINHFVYYGSSSADAERKRKDIAKKLLM